MISKDLYKIYTMKILESCFLSDGVPVMRVPGGWLFSNTFVPMTKECDGVLYTDKYLLALKDGNDKWLFYNQEEDKLVENEEDATWYGGVEANHYANLCGFEILIRKEE